jgi:hypothetical protein
LFSFGIHIQFVEADARNSPNTRTSPLKPIEEKEEETGMWDVMVLVVVVV